MKIRITSVWHLRINNPQNTRNPRILNNWLRIWLIHLRQKGGHEVPLMNIITLCCGMQPTRLRRQSQPRRQPLPARLNEGGNFYLYRCLPLLPHTECIWCQTRWCATCHAAACSGTHFPFFDRLTLHFQWQLTFLQMLSIDSNQPITHDIFINNLKTTLSSCRHLLLAENLEQLVFSLFKYVPCGSCCHYGSGVVLYVI